MTFPLSGMLFALLATKASRTLPAARTIWEASLPDRSSRGAVRPSARECCSVLNSPDHIPYFAIFVEKLSNDT
jgi:hypothetical protein